MKMWRYSACMRSWKMRLKEWNWNAIVGFGRNETIVGPYDLGRRNDRGGRMVEFCSRYRLIVANTWFQHHPHRRYTWRAPGDLKRYQIDYILVKERFRNQVKDCRSYAGPDIDSGHNMVLAECNFKLNKWNRRECRRWNLEKLEEEETRMKFSNKTKISSENCNKGRVEERWEMLQKQLLTTAYKVLGR